MYDCCDIPEPVESAEPIVFDVVSDPLPTTQVLLPDPYADIVQLLDTNPQPNIPMPIFDPNAPTLADINGHLDSAMLNIINPNPGYTADYNDITNELDWLPDA